jgi:gluconokinase
MSDKILVMGVAGCGKSTLGALLVQCLRGELVEGDDFHPRSNVEKMAAGIALQDPDRWPWLEQLAQELQRRPGPTILSCSALKRSYRDLLRASVPGLRIVYLAIGPGDAAARVAARAAHVFPPSLVASQFQALEPPSGEAGVLDVDARLPTEEQAAAVVAWLARDRTTNLVTS